MAVFLSKDDSGIRFLLSGQRPAAALAVALWMCVKAAVACSLTGCLNSGPEFNRTFDVVIEHDGKPLAGVQVEISGTSHLKASTTRNGRVRFSNLAPGYYWFSAQLLGISAAYECFHVTSRPGWRAKRHLHLDWGDEALSTRAVAGVLIDSQPGTGGNFIGNITHRVSVPIAGASLALQNPLTGQTQRTQSDSRGFFGFDNVPDGTYVLRIVRGREGRYFEPADVLLRVSKTGKKDRLTFTRTEPGGGSCGGPSLELM